MTNLTVVIIGVAFAGFATTAAAQDGTPGSKPGAGVGNAAGCEADVDLEYLQFDTVSHVEGEVANEDCSASRGNYSLEMRIRDEEGELQTLTFSESWRRNDDRPVQFSADYPIGENVFLLNVRASEVSCACTDANGVLAFVTTGVAAHIPTESGGRGERRRERQRRAEAANVVAVAVEPEVECRSMRLTGSRVPTRVCKTVEEWEAQSTFSQEGAKDFQRRNAEQSQIWTPRPQANPFEVPGAPP